MTGITVDGWDKNKPYAYLVGNPQKPVFLGTPILPFYGRLSAPVDQSLARAEAVPIEAHEVLSWTLALFSSSLSSQKKGGFDSVAIACLVSNRYLPKELRHTHPEVLAELNNRQSIKQLEQYPLTSAKSGLDWTSKIILKNIELFEPNASDYAHQLLIFSAMLDMFDAKIKDPRDFRLSRNDQYGILRAIK